ncbi:hypothetical protein E4U52_006945 [Claviceps spartinae]|nr:hypothetical protein E4U52_006945 [Claviceps spartinae]
MSSNSYSLPSDLKSQAIPHHFSYKLQRQVDRKKHITGHVYSDGPRCRNVTKTKFTKEKYDAAPKAKLSKIRGPASAAIPGHIPKSPNADNGFPGVRLRNSKYHNW